MPILNITRHKTTEGQKLDNVVDLPEYIIDEINRLCTFQPLPTLQELRVCAEKVVDIIENLQYPDVDGVMCGGAPYFNSILDKALISRGFVPHYPFTIRNYTRTTNPDGSINQQAVYKHMGLVKTA